MKCPKCGQEWEWLEANGLCYECQKELGKDRPYIAGEDAEELG